MDSEKSIVHKYSFRVPENAEKGTIDEMAFTAITEIEGSFARQDYIYRLFITGFILTRSGVDVDLPPSCVKAESKVSQRHFFRLKEGGTGTKIDNVASSTLEAITSRNKRKDYIYTMFKIGLVIDIGGVEEVSYLRAANVAVSADNESSNSGDYENTAVNLATKNKLGGLM